MSGAEGLLSASPSRGPAAEALARLFAHRSFLIGGALVLLVLALALSADLPCPAPPRAAGPTSLTRGPRQAKPCPRRLP